MKIKPLLTITLGFLLLGVSTFAQAQEYRLNITSYTDVSYTPWQGPFSVGGSMVVSSSNPSWTGIRDQFCDIVSGPIQAYTEDLLSRASVESTTASNIEYRCTVYYWQSGTRYTRHFQIGYTIEEVDVGTPPGSECGPDDNTEDCCLPQAEESCESLGGVYEWFWYPPDTVGGERCEWTCWDDLDDPTPPNPDPGINPPEPNPYPTPEPGPNPEILPPEPEPVPPPPSDSTDNQILAYYLDILARQAKYDPRVYAAVDQLRNDNNFNAVELRNLVNETNNRLGNNGEVLADILDAINNFNSDVPGDIEVPDIPGDRDEHLNWRLPGVDGDDPNFVDSPSYFESFVRDRIRDAGLEPDDSDFEVDDFELDVIDISERATDFELNLPDSECMGERVYNINGLSFTVDWNPLCDIFSWLGLLVVFSAWFSTPFIVFSATKK